MNCSKALKRSSKEGKRWRADGRFASAGRRVLSSTAQRGRAGAILKALARRAACRSRAGNGSNLLVPDEGVKGAVIQLDPKGFGGSGRGEPRPGRGQPRPVEAVRQRRRRPTWAASSRWSAFRLGRRGGEDERRRGLRDIGQVIERVKVMDTRGQVFYRERDDWLRLSHQQPQRQVHPGGRNTTGRGGREAHRKFMKESGLPRRTRSPMASVRWLCFQNRRPERGGPDRPVRPEGDQDRRRRGLPQARQLHRRHRRRDAKDVRQLIDLIRNTVHQQTATYLELELEIW